jgi:Fic family protein
MSEKILEKYPHIMFHKQWNLSQNSLLLLGQCEAYVKAINNTPILPKYYEQLMKVSLLKGAQSTTAIEGNTLSEEEIEKIMNNGKLPPSKEYQEIEVKNILAAFNELLFEVINSEKDYLITPELLQRFHRLVGQNLGEHFAAIPGKFRNENVIVGNYRCPDYEDLFTLVNKLCEWLLQEFKYRSKETSFSDTVIQAIITHIYIEWIHPFSDGNGRTGRLIEFYILLRGGNPDIASHILSNFYNLTRSEYYRQIVQATAKRDLSAFIEYALLGFRDGLVQTLETIQKSQFQNTWEKLIYDKFDSIREESRIEIFKRQRLLALELPFDIEFTAPKVSTISILLAKTYSNISLKTVQRDIEKLIELELVNKTINGYIVNTDSLRKMFAKSRG